MRTPRRPLTAEDIAIMRKEYPHRETKYVAGLLNRTVPNTYQAAEKLQLKKTPEFLAQRSGRLQKGSTVGIATRFKKGNVPVNKGRPGYSCGRMNETQFKKGQRSGVAKKNWRPIGTILPDSEGYLRIKVREAVHGQEPTGFGNMKVWPLLNRQIWEEANGPIPPKHFVKFKDGNRQNCTLENLQLISMADNARANGMWKSLPRELAEVVHMSGQLKRKLRNIDAKEHPGRSEKPPVRDAGRSERP